MNDRLSKTEDSHVTHCFIKPRVGDGDSGPLFEGVIRSDGNGFADVRVRLNRYAIIPLEDYFELTGTKDWQ